ncbi:D-alanyl-D-alanine carboxypeptidase [Streptomyces yokosukanensis]|uniref:serine-type D-Ala-D-Ala carboxypeptidase n=1 Tax=Streptomyces yokosukanensis TaxID=67386 RepID=A0A101P924_9ACTN|nr:D-alanyl-D-alanine carboxypeptidase [Streptomyces yokosukanensis]KUN07158.1 D-alanyl-D-alanine carboxypeptidase [Streptomyces yokosukanensis]
MAGESPDRSKQRESSPEVTSGSASPVPEAGDPRLAVAREKDSSPEGVDTSTKVLSIRDVKTTAPKPEAEETPAEDAALREAVSAWVRSADTTRPANNSDTPANAATGLEEADEEQAEPQNGTAEKNDADAETTDTEAKTDAEPETDAEGETAAATDAEPKAEASEAEAETEAETETPRTEDEPEAKSAPEGEDAAQAEDASETEGASEGKDAPEAEAGPKGEDSPKGEDEAADADGEDAPQGPPAADDETRADGAGGGDTDAEDEAEAAKPAEAPQATAPRAAVDQPTAVFKAVKPKQVDQPTTMLKLGGASGTKTPKTPSTPKSDSESDSERTSKFVALKNDMAPAAKPDVTTPVPQVGPERTTQQPLPPRPPLDLLAELTNTPPPPETAVRTIVRRVKIWTPLVVLLAIVFVIVQAVRPLPSPTLVLSGKDTYTFGGGRTSLPWPGEGQGWIDADGVGTVGNFGKQTPVAIGSVAKTMTSYIILRDHPLKTGQEGPKIKIDPKAETEGGYDKDGESTLNTIKAGDSLTEKQALSAVMIPSANNIARLLARWDAGSEAAFVKKMNDAAKELGMTHTKYTDPSGLKESTVSTAEDQVKLGRAVTKIPALVAITSAASWTDPSGHYWNNYNELPYKMGAIGIKTGSTTAAGGNLLFASRKQVGGQTVTIVGAILGQHKPKILDTANAVSRTALTAAQDALTSAKVLKKGDVVGYVDDQLGGHTPIVVTKDVVAVGWSGLKVKLSFTSGKVPHTAKAGTQVGTLTVGDGTAGAVKVPVALQKNLAEPGFGAKLTRLG